VETYAELQARIRSRERRWLVTGAAGFIGSHLVEQLLRLDQTVVSTSSSSAGLATDIAGAVYSRGSPVLRFGLRSTY
jgi:UDP-N-acetylglucosamine/UDP-N-acetylgalactosamine 4-epimerase